jgi:hypothetical protein
MSTIRLAQKINAYPGAGRLGSVRFGSVRYPGFQAQRETMMSPKTSWTASRHEMTRLKDEPLEERR